MKVKSVNILNNHSEDGKLDLIAVVKKLYPTLKLRSDNVIFIGNKFIFQSNNIEDVELVLYGLIAGSQSEKTTVERSIQKNLEELETNARKDYNNTPSNVLRYIIELENLFKN